MPITSDIQKATEKSLNSIYSSVENTVRRRIGPDETGDRSFHATAVAIDVVKQIGEKRIVDSGSLWGFVAERLKSARLAFGLEQVRNQKERLVTEEDAVQLGDQGLTERVEDFGKLLSGRDQYIFQQLERGRTKLDLSKELGISPPRITQILKRLGKQYVDYEAGVTS